MKNNQSPSPENDSLYFELQADFGITKHMGGQKATRELIALCHITAGQTILEVGCGLGRNTCAIAKTTGCKVVGIDLSPMMVQRSIERAKRQKLEDAVTFRVADATDLPFADGCFDAVLCESVTAFVKDKRKAVSEYMRVLKPGGYIGLNEVHWVRTPSPELVDYAAHIMAGADFLTSYGWKELLASAGLAELEARVYKLNTATQFIGEMEQLDLRDNLAAWRRFLSQSFTNPAYKKFARDVLGKPGNMFKFMKLIGYGIYAGKKS